MHGCGLRWLSLIFGIFGGLILLFFIIESLCNHYEKPEEKGFKAKIKAFFESFALGWDYASVDEQSTVFIAVLLIIFSIGFGIYSNSRHHILAEAESYYRSYTEALTREAEAEPEQVIGTYDITIVKPKKSDKYKKKLDYWYERAKR